LKQAFHGYRPRDDRSLSPRPCLPFTARKRVP
jgi:hypothetical protein